MTKQCLTFIVRMVLARLAWAENMVFPADTGVIDVTQPPYNADQTGKMDTSDAIRETRDGVVREAREQWGNVVLYVGYKDNAGGSGPAPKPEPEASRMPADK